MVRSMSKKKPPNAEEDECEKVEDPVGNDSSDRKRLKKLAISRGILKGTQAVTHSALAPSKTIMKHHGKDILRKSQRKNRYLFSFPGLLGPISGGKIGELKDLGTKNPVLYLEFPQGLMKLFGTIVYPKNRYLTLQFSKGGKNVVCEDYFDSLIVFSDAWWIGSKEENPEEERLDFPKEMSEGEVDFHGGAGTRYLNNEVKQKCVNEIPEQSFQIIKEDDQKCLKDPFTPTRHSERNAGRQFRFSETKSGDSSSSSDADADADAKCEEIDSACEDVKTTYSSRRILDYDKEDGDREQSSAKLSESSFLKTNSKLKSRDEISLTDSVFDDEGSHGSLIQPTVATLFKKVLDKKPVEIITASSSPRRLSSRKGSDKKVKQICSKRPTESSAKKAKVVKTKKVKSPTRIKAWQKVEEDDIEEFSSSSEDCDESDEDWGT